MNHKFIDLSLPLENSKSEPEPVVIDYVTHREGACILTKNTGLSPDSFVDGLAVNLERIRLTSHSGTHVDAPLHYGPISQNQKSKSIDEMPLHLFFGQALMLDCSGSEAKETVQPDEIEDALESQQLSIVPGDIVLIHTGADKLWGSAEYFTDFRGISLEATEKLLDFGVKVIGVDCFGFDAPFQKMIDAYKKTHDQSVLWPCHMIGRKREYCQIERLTNLSLLPRESKFLLSCFPIKLKGCGAGPSRVVAIIENHFPKQTLSGVIL
jgi:kynurenine formamidase